LPFQPHIHFQKKGLSRVQAFFPHHQLQEFVWSFKTFLELGFAEEEF